MKKIVVAILAIALVAGAFVYFSQDSAVNESTVMEEQKEPVAPTGEGEEVFVLDSANSELKWAAEKVIGAGQSGTVEVKEGQVVLDEGQVTNGQFVIDMTSIADDKGQARLVDHLKNEDFFNVAQYPDCTMAITRLEAISETEVKVVGDLTVKDVTAPIEFPATLTLRDDGLDLAAQFAIDRTTWGITYGSGSFFGDLGDKAIKDDIGFDLNVKMVRQ